MSNGTTTFEVLEGRVADVGGVPVVRALPKRHRRTIGPWCFADHFGPVDVTRADMQVGPHPHTGLHTVTWLFSGEIRHRDSVGTVQMIRPGQLNLMSAGHGVSHSEETPEGATGILHGLQLWVAQPEATRHGPPAFEHHASLPQAGLDGATATVLVGEFAGTRSPARTDVPTLGVDLLLDGDTTVPLDPAYEHGLLVVDGTVTAGEEKVRPGVIAYLAPGPDHLSLSPAGPARVVILGGAPFAEEIRIWWNLVARTAGEIEEAAAAWNAGSDRFGSFSSPLGRIDAPPVR